MSTIKYYKTSRDDVFVTDGTKWIYFYWTSFCVLIEDITDPFTLPKELEEITPETSEECLPIFPEEATSLNEHEDEGSKRGKIKNRLLKIEYTYGYPDMLNLIKETGKDESWDDKYTFSRSGIVTAEHFRTREMIPDPVRTFSLPYEKMMELFDTSEKYEKAICDYSTLYDDHAGSIDLIYDNGKRIHIGRGCKTPYGYLSDHFTDIIKTFEKSNRDQ